MEMEDKRSEKSQNHFCKKKEISKAKLLETSNAKDTFDWKLDTNDLKELSEVL